MKRVTVNVDKSNADWFEKTYPNGSYSWLFDMLLQKFREVHKITPAELAQLAATETMKER